jgi:YD repeat-containing protein
VPLLVYAAIGLWDYDRAWSIPEASTSGVSFWFLLLGGHTLFLMIRLPRYIVVSNDALIVQYTLWRRTVPYSAIANISLTRGRDPRGRYTDLFLVRAWRIRIDLRNFVVFTLANLSKDQTLLYEALCPLWEKASGELASRVETVQPLTKLSMPYERPRRTASDIRRFPSWVAPVVIIVAAGAALLAPRSVWRKLRTQPAPTPDLKALASFQRIGTGWAAAPVPIFPGETLGGRWNVDYATGAFTHSQTDFHIGDSIAIDVTRVFLNKESDEAFGAGMSVSYDMYLVGDAERFTYLLLKMPDGEHFHFTRTSPGTSWIGSVFRGDSTSGPGANPFAGSTLWWNGSGWSLMQPDRTLMKFPGVRGNLKHGQGALLSIEDAKGSMLKIDRDSIGNILKISSPHNAFVIFQHDSHNHIISATDSFGKTVLYDYDENQRLVRIEDPKEGVTHYVYGENENLVEIVKPDGSTWLKIGYDDRGRVADLTFQEGSSCRYRYQTDSRGMIAAVDVVPSKGPSKHVSLASHAG